MTAVSAFAQSLRSQPTAYAAAPLWWRTPFTQPVTRDELVAADPNTNTSPPKDTRDASDGTSAIPIVLGSIGGLALLVGVAWYWFTRRDIAVTAIQTA